MKFYIIDSTYDFNQIHFAISYSKTGNNHFAVHHIEMNVGGNKDLYTPALVDYYDSLDKNTIFEILLDVGSVHRVSGMKANDGYGFMIEMEYLNTNKPVQMYSKTLFGGVWGSWIDITSKILAI